MYGAGRFEELGWALSREIIVAVCKEDAEFQLPSWALSGMLYPSLAVSFSWILAAPVIYGGRLLDGLVGNFCPPEGTNPLVVDETPYMSGPLESGVEGDEEPKGFVIDI